MGINKRIYGVDKIMTQRFNVKNIRKDQKPQPNKKAHKSIIFYTKALNGQTTSAATLLVLQGLVSLLM